MLLYDALINSDISLAKASRVCLISSSSFCAPGSNERNNGRNDLTTRSTTATQLQYLSTHLKTSIPASPNLSELIAKNGIPTKIHTGIQCSTTGGAFFLYAMTEAMMA